MTVSLTADRAVDFGVVTLTAPGGRTVSGFFGQYDLNEGVYEMTLHLPRYLEAGAWSVSVYLQDFESRTSYYSPSGMPLPAGRTFPLSTRQSATDTALPSHTRASLRQDSQAQRVAGAETGLGTGPLRSGAAKHPLGDRGRQGLGVLVQP